MRDGSAERTAEARSTPPANLPTLRRRDYLPLPSLPAPS